MLGIAKKLGFGKKDSTTDDSLEASLSRAEKAMKEIEEATALARKVQADMARAQALAQTGLDATARVERIEDTGRMINFDPVVMLSLQVTPAQGAPFAAAGEVTVSKLAVPRAGETIRIKYDGANPATFVVLP